ncbi:hypothetical protein IWQ60_009808 [Tieghemiomyces parasiticus]|uniref:N-alpha-acetyltransferase 40 n=1 Tax=Tieghemiomyces parasiticus TaxID=78921 RepID=A0A9W8DPJ4_9FUNG|nr:hypothetical protein IWQ60_009808 [Tieghemiomyces parasiticus]
MNFCGADSQATSRTLLDQLRPDLVSMPGFSLRSFRTNDLSKHQRTWIFDLLRTNIKACYEKAGWGWHEYSKRREVFDPATRFLVVYRTATADQPEKPLAFASYRFTMDTDVSGQEIPVLYIYELQVAAHARSRGLGSWLTECILRLGFNTDAMRFYLAKMGFHFDETSPSQYYDSDEEIPAKQTSYEILSKPLRVEPPES